MFCDVPQSSYYNRLYSQRANNTQTRTQHTRVWDRDGTLEHSLASHEGAIFALRWSPSVRSG